MAADDAHDERAQDHDSATPAPSEQTPLLARDGDEEQARPQARRSASSALFSRVKASGKGFRRRWPSLLALLLLCIVVVLIMVFAFLAPSVVEQYAQQAVTFEPTSLSIVGFSSKGVQARVQGDFMLDGSKVEPKSVRDLGRFGTWIAHKAESGESTVEVSLPEYGNIVLGTAEVPPIVVDLRDGQVTHVEFVTDLYPGEFEGIRRIASDWIEGRLGQLRVVGKADVPVKSGLFSFGTQKIIHELLFHNKDIPTMPAYKIKKLNVHEVEVETGTAMAADVSLSVANPYPVELTVPPMSFDILVNGCEAGSEIRLADATTHELSIRPKKNVELDVTGLVRTLPDVLTAACPGSMESPLDLLLGNYIRGKKTTIYVKGADNKTADTPDWISEILSSITVPVDVPSKSFGHLIKNMSTTETHFSLPDPWAAPGTPEASPRISALLVATVALPEEMNFNVSAEKVRAHAKVYYKKKQLGLIDIEKWLPASSRRSPPKPEDDTPELIVEARLKDVPVNITDDDLLTDVIQELILGSGNVVADLKAKVDVGVNTALGSFAVRNIPAEGQVPIKPITSNPPSTPGHNGTSPEDMIKLLHPQVYNISVVSTTPTSLTIAALVNISNPTEYEANIPYLSLHVLTNDTIIANASVSNMEIRRGNNTALRAKATWNPVQLGGGPAALRAGVLFLGQYISGYNTTVTIRPHAGSIPALPGFSRAISKFNVTIPTPRLPSLSPPDDDDDDPDDSPGGPRFIDQARFHLFSSTADFVLRSPLPHDILRITYINATAMYKDSRLGQIEYDEPFEVMPIDPAGVGSLTPRLPVDWDTGSVGWDAVRRALGGTLKIAASAVVNIAIGKWHLAGVRFEGHGLGVGVRP